MKNYIAGLLFILVLVSCNTKNKKIQDEGEGYIYKQVGTIHNGIYEVSDKDSINKKWSQLVIRKLNYTDSIKLKDFRIIKTHTQGKAVKECYLLLASTPDNVATIGAILNLEHNKFYFEQKEVSGKKSIEIIICKGQVCNDGKCSPYVMLVGNDKKLICSSCEECEKISGDMF